MALRYSTKPGTGSGGLVTVATNALYVCWMYGSSHTGHNNDEEDACCPQVHTITTSFNELVALSKLLLLSHTEHSGL